MLRPRGGASLIQFAGEDDGEGDSQYVVWPVY